MLKTLTIMTALAPLPCLAQETLGAVAERNLPAGTVIQPGDVAAGPNSGTGIDPALAIGQQTRVAVYAGRPIAANQLAAPTLIARNQVVALIYESGGLRIQTEGRALGAGSEGEVIRVMNLSSRATLNARVNPDGTLSVASPRN